MSVLGKLDELLAKNGDWAQHIKRMDLFFIANNITEEPQTSYTIEFL